MIDVLKIYYHKVLFQFLKPLSFVCCVALCFSFTSFSDWKEINYSDASKELIALNKHFAETKSYAFTVVYKTYKGHNVDEIHEQNKGTVVRDGINYRSEIMG